MQVRSNIFYKLDDDVILYNAPPPPFPVYYTDAFLKQSPAGFSFFFILLSPSESSLTRRTGS